MGRGVTSYKFSKILCFDQYLKHLFRTNLYYYYYTAVQWSEIYIFISESHMSWKWRQSWYLDKDRNYINLNSVITFCKYKILPVQSEK